MSAAPLDELVEQLHHGEKTWAGLSLADRRQLLADLTGSVQKHAWDRVEVACQIKQLPVDSPLADEE